MRQESTASNNKTTSRSSSDSLAPTGFASLVQKVESNEDSKLTSSDRPTVNNNHYDQDMTEKKSLRERQDEFGPTSSANSGGGIDTSIYHEIDEHKDNSDDVMLWSENAEDEPTELHKDNDYHNIEKTTKNYQKSSESNTAESKFFRFSALAKELSGR